ncbi:hypothetical protein [Mycobacteroides abscessus]|uniref:hypothetical protein n=1 Tax=Mycobacteroides abscessus TaxID=36809 RepID=UPI00092A2E80|nr:hypothetical protein [Mycobacteroides abscessus]SHW60759.1 Uncharacterised protein [Mycobacteroides abscessus subsp. abscessus]SIE94319.1 Uncharacterised protein [Mycobacteroides abscessus subsp. abscessus]SII29299.1 Uncharacterised protein [Mycobacteroides abscessus subsp. abscessus]
MSNTVSTPKAGKWLRTLLSGKPHQVIPHDTGEKYLSRWYLWPRNARTNLYLHRFHSSDRPPPHCHPWPFVSLILKGSYYEVTETATILRTAGSLALRPAEHRHQIVLPTDDYGNNLECLTVIWTGRNIRTWGFWCPRPGAEPRFVPWKDFGPGGCAEYDLADGGQQP